MPIVARTSREAGFGSPLTFYEQDLLDRYAAGKHQPFSVDYVRKHMGYQMRIFLEGLTEVEAAVLYRNDPWGVSDGVKAEIRELQAIRLRGRKFGIAV